MNIFVVFKLQEGEKENAYSLVNQEILDTIPENIILVIKENMEEKLYSTEELEQLRDELVALA